MTEQAEPKQWRMHEHDCPYCQCPGDPLPAEVVAQVVLDAMAEAMGKVEFPKYELRRVL